MFGKKNTLAEKLKLQAQSLGACEEGIENVDNLNEQELINRWLHFINFAIKYDYPSNGFIKENFDRNLLEHNNIYVDANFERRNARQIVVVQGSSKGNLLYDCWTTSDVYVRHDSEVVIDCTRYSKVFVHVYDNAKVKIRQSDAATVYVYRYSKNCEITTQGDVLVRNCGG
jgi:hypothetical protein